MNRITTAAALRKLAERINEITKNKPDDEPYSVNLDRVLSIIENGK